MPRADGSTYPPDMAVAVPLIHGWYTLVLHSTEIRVIARAMRYAKQCLTQGLDSMFGLFRPCPCLLQRFLFRTVHASTCNKV